MQNNVLSANFHNKINYRNNILFSRRREILKRSAKIMALLLVLTMCMSLALVGCGKQDDTQKDQNNKTEDNNSSEKTEENYDELVAKLPTLKILTDDSDVAKRDTQVYQQMWEKNLGVKVEIESTTFQNRIQRMNDMDYEICLAGWGPDYNDPMTFMDLWVTDGPQNQTAYSNPKYDELIDKAKHSADNDERMDLMVEAEKILMEDMPIGPIYFRYMDYIKNPAVKNEVRRFIGANLDLYWAEVEGRKDINLNLSSEPPQLDPQLSQDATSFQIQNAVFEGLIRMDKDNKPTPGMAKDWKVSDDGMKWTFNIRDDAKWSNGDPVTAHDFEYAWKRALDPETASPYSYILYPIKNAESYNTNGGATADEVGVKAVDDKTLEVELELPTPYFDTLTAFNTYMPCNEKFFKKQGGKYAAEAKNLIYNGPWVIDEWNHESKIVLKKNPNYWNKDAINIDTVNYVMIKDSNTSLNMFKTGELDITGVRGDQRESVKSEGHEIYNFSDGSSWYLQFNTNNEVLKNAKIRKALTYALERENYVKNILRNDSKVALGYVPPVMPGKSGFFRDEVGDLFQDAQIEEAKKLLIEGIKELGLDK